MRVKVMVGAILLSLFVTLFFVLEHKHRDCICSILTQKEERYPLSLLPSSMWDEHMSESGVFIRMITSCEHGTRIHATIYPDQEYFLAHIEK